MIELARRRMMMGGSAKPYDAEVEWLESTGTQYIALGLTMLGTDIVTVRCKDTDTTIELNPIFGREKEKDDKYWAGFYAGDGRLFYYNTYLTAVWTALIRDGQYYMFDTNWNTFVFNGTYCDINGIRYQQNKPNHRTDSPDLNNPYLFGCHGTSASIDDILGSVRISSFKIERNGVTIMDLIPVRKGNTGYMYNKVSGRLFGNQGTGSFVVGPDYDPFAYQYLTFVPLEDSTFSFSKRGTGNDIEYSIDGGAWTSLASEANTPTVGAGHNIRWRAELVPSVSGNRGIGIFSASGLYETMGNIMSLLYGDNYIGQTTLVGTYTFYQLWLNDTHIYRADRTVLPATTLVSRCYSCMYKGCSSLISVQQVLPATILKSLCYYEMYRDTAIDTAPLLPASILVERCYTYMYTGCTNLRYIKMLATDISATNCLYAWVSGVVSTGTFIKHSQTTLPTGVSGIPSGWTVIDDSSTITT